jgi:hypothetical protein
MPERTRTAPDSSGPLYAYSGLILVTIAVMASLGRSGNDDPSTAGTIVIGLVGAAGLWLIAVATVIHGVRVAHKDLEREAAPYTDLP